MRQRRKKKDPETNAQTKWVIIGKKVQERQVVPLTKTSYVLLAKYGGSSAKVIPASHVFDSVAAAEESLAGKSVCWLVLQGPREDVRVTRVRVYYQGRWGTTFVLDEPVRNFPKTWQDRHLCSPESTPLGFKGMKVLRRFTFSDTYNTKEEAKKIAREELQEEIKEAQDTIKQAKQREAKARKLLAAVK